MTVKQLKEKIENWVCGEMGFKQNKIRLDKQLIPQYKWSPRPDLDLLLDDKTRIFIEIENKTQDPEGNVVKYWWWMESGEEKSSVEVSQLKKVVLIQVFGEGFRKENLKLKIDLCKFIATRMANNLPCIFHYHDFKGELVDTLDKIKSILKVYIDRDYRR